MVTLEALEKQIRSAGDLHSIVRTMKALAASSIRQYEKAVASLDEYYRTVELGLRAVLLHREEKLPPPPAQVAGPLLLVVYGSDHGLTGRFNEQVAAFAASREGFSDESTVIFCVGEQALARLPVSPDRVAALFPVPVSLAAISRAVQRILLKIEEARGQNAARRIHLIYNRPLSHASFTPAEDTLLPVDLRGLQQGPGKWPSRSLPAFSMNPERLFSALLRQFFFVSLYRAYALSLAAENASRLAAMQSAEKNIEERLAELRSAFQQQRQEAITAELLDIVSGFRSLKTKIQFRDGST